MNSDKHVFARWAETECRSSAVRAQREHTHQTHSSPPSALVFKRPRKCCTDVRVTNKFANMESQINSEGLLCFLVSVLSTFADINDLTVFVTFYSVVL